VVNLALANEDPLQLVSVLRAADATHETPICWSPNRVRKTASCVPSNWARVTGSCSRSTPTSYAPGAQSGRRKFYQDRLRSDLAQPGNGADRSLTGLYNQRYLRRHLTGLMESGQAWQLAC